MIPVDRGLDTEMGEPNYARIERERRWLVDVAARPDLDDAFVSCIADRYIDGIRMRLRRMERGGPRRDQVEADQEVRVRRPAGAADRHGLHDRARIRVAVRIAGARAGPAATAIAHRSEFWSLDGFEGALGGFELVECEAPDEAALARLQPPDWVLREVTDLPHWRGGALAANRIPEDRWPSS
jgi:hypothetical protein